MDTSEGFICQCRPGYALDETGKNCTGGLKSDLWPQGSKFTFISTIYTGGIVDFKICYSM